MSSTSPAPRGTALHQLALRVLPDATGATVRHGDWAATIATVAAWPSMEPTQPVIERRFWRTTRRGRLQQAVLAGLRDPLGLCTPQEATRELRELMRPLWSARPMPAASPSILRQLEDPVVGYAAELGDLETALPEGAGALLALFGQLLEGLAALDGPVGLSLCAMPLGVPLEPGDERLESTPAPAPADLQSPPAAARRIRGVGFALRLFAEHRIPATLRARAEALCLARRARERDWHVAVDAAAVLGARSALREQRPMRPLPMCAAPSDVAALTLALPEPNDPTALSAVGRPFAGPLPAQGAVLGRVPRADGRHVPWRLSWDERRLHVLIAGASGCGKTTTMIRMALDDVATGRTVVLVDPHGDVANQLAAVAPPRRLLHIDPRLPTTAALDLLDPDPARAAAHLLSAVSEVWPADFAGPVWQRAVSLACRCLHASAALDRRATIADVERFFVDTAWREQLLTGVGDETLRGELQRESEAWKRPARDDASMINWLSSKLTPLTQGPGRPLFSVPVAAPLEAEVARGSIVVVALPVGTLGRSTTALVTRMFLTRLTAAIAAQGDRALSARHPVSVFIDEAHMAAGQALAGLFAQARKFNCSVTVACQSPSQLEPHLEDVLTNAQTHLYGRLSRKEALHLGARIGEQGVLALPRLPRHHLVLVLEDDDPDLGPIVLTPIAPPALPEPVRASERPAVEDPDLGEMSGEPDVAPPSFDDVLVELFAIPGGVG